MILPHYTAWAYKLCFGANFSFEEFKPMPDYVSENNYSNKHNITKIQGRRQGVMGVRIPPRPRSSPVFHST